MLHISSDLRHHFKGYNFSPEVIMLFVYMKLRFTLSYRDLEEMMHIRGARVDHSSVQRWVVRFSRLIDSRVRQRKKPMNGSWRMDETYIRLNGKWVYLYRAVDKYGDTIDFLLRAKRDGNAAKAFFKKAFKTHGRPDTVNIDKSGSNRCALEHYNKGLDDKDQYKIRRIKYLNNIVEQEHRFIKKRTKPMMGFKNFYAAKQTISGIENIRMIQKGQIKGHNKQISTFHNFANLMA